MSSNPVASFMFLAAILSASGCDNGPHHNNLVAPGNRFELVIESDRTSVEASHFLVDTLTGDTWLLTGKRGSFEWVRMAVPPEDIQQVDLMEIFGLANGDDSRQPGRGWRHDSESSDIWPSWRNT